MLVQTNNGITLKIKFTDTSKNPVKVWSVCGLIINDLQVAFPGNFYTGFIT